jgi:transcription antitermination factor NusG
MSLNDGPFAFVQAGHMAELVGVAPTCTQALDATFLQVSADAEVLTMIPVSSEMLARVFRFGTGVIVAEGPFEGLRATVLGVGDDRRVIVTVTLARGMVPLTVDPAAVRIETPPPATGFAAH